MTRSAIRLTIAGVFLAVGLFPARQAIANFSAGANESPALRQEQASAPVPVSKEPHHHLRFENEYVRALRVSIPAGDATLPHQHDLPYIYVSIGPADLANEMPGKAPARIKMMDGQLGYSPGRFAHIARADAGIPFENVTVELLQAQGQPRNLCEKIVPGESGRCDLSSADSKLPIHTTPLLETDAIRVYSIVVQPGTSLDSLRDEPGLLIAVDGASAIRAVAGKGQPGSATGETTLGPGEFVWIPQHSMIKYTVGDGGNCRLVLISFQPPRETTTP